MGSGNPFGVCRNCDKQIMWIRIKAGKNMPVDPTIISYRRPEVGKKATERIVTLRIVTFAGEVVAADKVNSSEAEGTSYISHFATCTKRHR